MKRETNLDLSFPHYMSLQILEGYQSSYLRVFSNQKNLTFPLAR